MKRIREWDEDYVGSHTPARLGWKILLAFVVVAVVLLLVGLGLGWIRTGARVVGPENVRQQWQFAYDYNESLKGIAGNWCTLKAEENATTDPEVKTQRVSQRIAVETNYRRVAAEYDARLADAFRARLVKPADVPDKAPSLEQATAALGCGP